MRLGSSPDATVSDPQSVAGFTSHLKDRTADVWIGWAASLVAVTNAPTRIFEEAMTHYSTLVQRCRSTNSLLADEIDAEYLRLERERDGEKEARHKADAALRAKDRAMDVLFRRMRTADVDYSDLIP